MKKRTLNELRQVKTFGYKNPKLSKMVKKSNYTKRRAIDCKIVERSKNNPGYCKYMVTVAEMDGTITKHPVYGKDMQNALKRLMNQEKTIKVQRNTGAGTMFITWMVLMGVPAYFMEKTGSPFYLLYGFLGVGVIIGLIAWWNNYITKGE